MRDTSSVALPAVVSMVFSPESKLMTESVDYKQELNLTIKIEYIIYL